MRSQGQQAAEALGCTLLPPNAAPISAPLVPTLTYFKVKHPLEVAILFETQVVHTFTIPVSDPEGPIHVPTFLISRVQRLEDKP
jgi:hypothetical protein